MIVLQDFYKKISSLLPRRIVRSQTTLLTQAGFEGISPHEYFGFVLFVSACVAATVFFVAHLFTTSLPLVLAAAAAAFVGVEALFYLFLFMAVDSRAQKIEALLPDMLEIISANIRAGMTLENAIWSAARPEFGPLKDEIKKVSADSFGGKPITESLAQMPRRVKSETLDRSIKLMVEGIRLGGEMSNLLREVAADIRNSQLLKKEIIASTTMYSMFIIFAAVIAAPLLFAISVYYAEMSESLLAKQEASGGVPSGALQQAGMVGSAVGGLMSLGKQPVKLVPASEVRLFAMACIVLTTFFAGIILGLIRFGKAVRGIKYVPLFVVGGLGVFLFAHSFLGTAFRSIMR